MLKTFFMTPKTEKVLNEARMLAELTEDEEYLIFIEDIPTQVMSAEEAELLTAAAESLDSMLKAGFVITFALNLVLKGVMAQLWNIFNTL